MIALDALPFDVHQAMSRALQVWDETGLYDEEFCEVDADVMDDFFQRMKPLGFVAWDAGAFRAVFVHGEWVLKVPLRPELEIESEIEARRFHEIQATAPEYLPLTAFLPEGVVVAERLDPRPDAYYAREEEIASVAEKLGVPDLRLANVGWRGERFYFIDLGGAPGTY